MNPSVGQVPPLASPVPAGMVCIYDQRLSADAASFDVQNISQAYAHLKIVASLRGTVAGALGDAHMRFNNDTANNYDGQWIRAIAATVASGESFSGASGWLGSIAGSTAGANTWSPIDMTLADYTSAREKYCQANTLLKMSTATTDIRLFSNSFAWRGTAAVNRVTIFPASGNWAAGSRLTIYGLLSQGAAPPVTTLAPGGIGTSFPVSPANGELFTLVDSLTAPTFSWRFRYVPRSRTPTSGCSSAAALSMPRLLRGIHYVGYPC